MVTATAEKEEVQGNQIVTHNWILNEDNLDGWKPYSVVLYPYYFLGPADAGQRMISLRKNTMIFIDGHRGAFKTGTMTFLECKEMRLGKTSRDNYPISFYVAEQGPLTGWEPLEWEQITPCHWKNKDGSLSYYENLPLDMKKFYTFDKEIRNGSVGIDELQYFVESRTSGRLQNRILSYQIMQIRKTANSFFYTVQNPKWVDNRFGWSADIEIMCRDVASMCYNKKSVGRELREGEITRWTFRDISGIITGEPFTETGRDLKPNLQFHAEWIWNTFPTHMIIDPEAAVYSYENSKKEISNNKDDQLLDALNATLDSYYEETKRPVIDGPELKRRLEETLKTQVDMRDVGRVLAPYNIIRQSGTGNQGKYDFTPLLNEEAMAK